MLQTLHVLYVSSLFARTQLAKEAEQTQHGTHCSLATTLMMGTSVTDFFLLAIISKLNEYGNYWCPK